VTTLVGSPGGTQVKSGHAWSATRRVLGWRIEGPSLFFDGEGWVKYGFCIERLIHSPDQTTVVVRVEEVG